MNDYYYFNVIRKTTVSLLEYFNGMHVGRYTDEGILRKSIKVPLKFSPKEKSMAWLYNKSKEVLLPQMAMHMTAVDFDSNRVTS